MDIIARWGKCVFPDLEKLQENMKYIQQEEINLFIESCAKELAARLLRKVIKRTPRRLPFKRIKINCDGKRMKYKKGVNAGKYKMRSVNIGGTLIRGWTSATHEEAVNGKGDGTLTPECIDSLKVKKNGDVYTIEIINPVKYASYVEYGHLTRGHDDWVRGRFMLSMSVDEIKQIAPDLLRKKVAEFLKECLG